jgi:hypothetical protein
MNPAPPAPARRRLIWPWVLGICLTPFVLLAVVAASYLTLDRDVAVLRKHVMTATDAGWHTKIQLSIGGLTLGAVRTGLWFAHGREVADARLALEAIRHASVGVYERTSAPAAWSREQLFTSADQAMQRRGWTRLVGVADGKDTVLIYVPQDIAPDEPVDVCLAVVDDNELVVASTSVNAAALAELAAKHSPGEIKRSVHLANFRF